MTKQIHSMALAVRLLPLGMFLFTGMQTAQAIECSAAIPSHPQGHWSYRYPQGHWSYRLIDGRKCWYQGENNLSKSLLRWPGETSARSAPDDALALAILPPVKEKIEESDSFEARWRNLLGRQER